MFDELQKRLKQQQDNNTSNFSEAQLQPSTFDNSTDKIRQMVVDPASYANVKSDMIMVPDQEKQMELEYVKKMKNMFGEKSPEPDNTFENSAMGNAPIVLGGADMFNKLRNYYNNQK